MAWKELGSYAGRDVLPWGQGVLLTDGTKVLLATPEGIDELPMSRAVLGPDGPLAGSSVGLSGAGGMGMVVDSDRGQTLFSTDGTAWSLADEPAGWTAPATLIHDMAVGDAAILVRVDHCSDPAVDISGCIDGYVRGAVMVNTLWRGTVAP
jgi:hypothetical protein